jgi:hypothetical protein
MADKRSTFQGRFVVNVQEPGSPEHKLKPGNVATVPALFSGWQSRRNVNKWRAMPKMVQGANSDLTGVAYAATNAHDMDVMHGQQALQASATKAAFHPNFRVLKTSRL